MSASFAMEATNKSKRNHNKDKDKDRESHVQQAPGA